MSEPAPTSASIPDVQETFPFHDAAVWTKKLEDAIRDRRPIREVGRCYALRLLAQVRNKVHAAKFLGIDRRTLQRWARAEGEPPQQAFAARKKSPSTKKTSEPPKGTPGGAS